MVRPRLEFVAREFSAESTSVGDGSKPLDSSKVFEPWERRLWASHVKLALTMGRGRSSPLQVFRAISTAEKEKRSDNGIRGRKPSPRRDGKSKAKVDSSDETRKLWPLSLPGVQHALVASMVLSSVAVDESKMSDDEEASSPGELLFLCQSFFNSMEDFIAGNSSIQPPNPGVATTLTISEDVPISLRDARLFAVAVTRLRRDDQKAMLVALIDVLHGGLQQLQSTGADAFASNGDLSHMFARGITLCAALVDVVSNSPDLQLPLSMELESTGYGIPKLKMRPVATNRHPVYNKEVFQGLFADWQSPSVPYHPAGMSTMEMLEGAVYEKLGALLQRSLAEGFQASPHDGCHLLFSSWNAAAKLSSWTALGWDGPAPVSTSEKQSSVDRLLRLREDMCGLHDLVHFPFTCPPESLLLKMIQSKVASSHRRSDEAILSGLSSAEKMLEFLSREIGKARSEPPTNLPTTADFVYYEALPMYVSFLMSVHTRPGMSDMGLSHRIQTSRSAQQRRARKTSSTGRAPSSEESDLEVDEVTADDIVRRNALNRLHEACLALGAAPCHPDWLDAACRMGGKLVPSIAVDSAAGALSALTKFGTAALGRYFEEMRQVLGAPQGAEGSSSMRRGGGEAPSGLSSLALQLCVAQQRMPPGRSDAFYMHVASFCQVNSSILKLLLDNLPSWGQQQYLAGSELAANSAQRIKGANFTKPRKVVPGEHRANGQWETLLSESLGSSSLAIPAAIVDDVMDGDEDLSDAAKQCIVDVLVMARRWRRVLYCVVNAMIPAAALLRFGVNNGKGRCTHPTCDERLPGSIFSSDDHEGGSPTSSRFSTESEAIVQNALSFLSCLAVCSSNDEDMHLASRAAAGHLLENAAHFGDLMSLWLVRISCSAIDGVVQTLAPSNETTSDLTASQLSSARAIIEATLKQYADSDDDAVDESGLPTIALNDSLDYDKRTTFLACLGLRGLKVGRLIGNRTNLELTDMLTKVDPFIGKDESWDNVCDAMKLLLNFLCGKVQLPVRTRIFVAEMLCSMMDAEETLRGKTLVGPLSGGPHGKKAGCPEIVRLSAAAALDELSKEEVLLFMENISYHPLADLESIGPVCEETKRLNEKMARVLSYLASAFHPGVSGDGCKIILEELLASIDRWAGSPAQNHLIKVFCLLASRFGALDDAGKIIISLLKPEKEGVNVAQEYVDTAKDFFQFVASLDQLVNQQSSTPSTQVVKFTPRASDVSSCQSTRVRLKNGEEVSRTCSFVETGEGFTEQHW